METWQKILIALTAIVVAILAGIGLVALVAFLYLTSTVEVKAATSGYNEYLSACSTKYKGPFCKCVIRNLKADNTTDDEARYLAQAYGEGIPQEKKDDASVELEYWHAYLQENCEKNSNFKE